MQNAAVSPTAPLRNPTASQQYTPNAHSMLAVVAVRVPCGVCDAQKTMYWIIGLSLRVVCAQFLSWMRGVSRRVDFLFSVVAPELAVNPQAAPRRDGNFSATTVTTTAGGGGGAHKHTPSRDASLPAQAPSTQAEASTPPPELSDTPARPVGVVSGDGAETREVHKFSSRSNPVPRKQKLLYDMLVCILQVWICNCSAHTRMRAWTHHIHEASTLARPWKYRKPCV